jgi:phage terminase large subunit
MKNDRMRDPEKHAHIWLGNYVVRSDAQVFRNWSSQSFEAPEDAPFRFGADWGFSNNPTVLVRCFVGRWDNRRSPLILRGPACSSTARFGKSAVRCLTPALFTGRDKKSPPRWANPQRYPVIPGSLRHTITADSARPETIDHMRRLGLLIKPAIKGPSSVEDGIGFLKSYDIVVHPRCTHLIDELIHYSWAIDRMSGEMLRASQIARTTLSMHRAMRSKEPGAVDPAPSYGNRRALGSP